MNRPAGVAPHKSTEYSNVEHTISNIENDSHDNSNSSGNSNVNYNSRN